MSWINYILGFFVMLAIVPFFIMFRRWQNQKLVDNKVLLEVLPPTGQLYYALATKDEKQLTIESPSVKDKKYTYIIDQQATWDTWYPFSDWRITQAQIKKGIYYEGQKEPACKRGEDEIANARTVAIIQDSNDLAAIAREVRGDNDSLFGKNTNLILIIVVVVGIVVSGLGAYYGYTGDQKLATIQSALGIAIPKPAGK